MKRGSRWSVCDAWALADPKTDEREVLADMLTGDQDPLASHPGQTIVGDKGYVSKPAWPLPPTPGWGRAQP